MMKTLTAGPAAVLCLLALLAAASAVAEVHVANPHKEPPEHCNACHTTVPTSNEVEKGEFKLLKDSVDETCHICHPYDCCRLYALKGHNHPSNISKWDAQKFMEPKNLPLHDGLITCNTCHFHRQPAGPTYRMVRIVKIELERVDWTELCHECHLGY